MGPNLCQCLTASSVRCLCGRAEEGRLAIAGVVVGEPDVWIRGSLSLPITYRAGILSH